MCQDKPTPAAIFTLLGGLLGGLLAEAGQVERRGLGAGSALYIELGIGMMFFITQWTAPVLYMLRVANMPIPPSCRFLTCRSGRPAFLAVAAAEEAARRANALVC